MWGREPPPTEEVPTREDAFSELRRLLLSTEQARLREILLRLNDPDTRAEEISRVLPDAIVRGAAEDEELVSSLVPVVEDVLRVSVRKAPQTLADILFPVMGPAIRRSVSEFVRGMVQSMNRAMENSLSPRSLKWRIESWRTGIPFAEIVLLRSLVYRVEQVFLIHRETGLLLSQATAEAVVSQDPDLVSGMLTAIRDFVRDSFGARQGDDLENLRVGELLVVIEQGPSAYLAAVVRGTPPAELPRLLAETLETVHHRFRDELESFEGDAAPFEAAEEPLRQCLRDRRRDEDEDEEEGKTFPYFKLILILFAAALACWLFFEIRDRLRRQDYLNALRNEKGIVVISAETRGGKYVVSGLRDPLATDPKALIAKSGLKPDEVVGRWERFDAIEPKFVPARAREVLNPPATVSLSFKNGVLTAKGTAPHQWVVDARRLAPVLPGVKEYDDSDLRVDYRGVLAEAMKRLEPPKTVSLSIEDGVLHAKGSAPRRWTIDARRFAPLIPGVKSFADKDLRVDYRPVLQGIRKRLAAPESVLLSLDHGVLTAKGTAPHQWVVDARKLARLLPEVKDYRDNELSIDYSRVLDRIRRRLAPPKTVSLRIVDGVLIASGRAPHRWIVETRKTARGIREISGYRDNAVGDLDKERFERLKAGVEQTRLNFAMNAGRLVPGQEEKLSGILSSLRALQSLARILHVRVLVHVLGHTDSSGSENKNIAVSKHRADQVASYLEAGGISRANLVVRGVGSSRPLVAETSNRDRELNRRVDFTVVVRDPAEEGEGR
jgi:OOP family OmpA-OmpF porin